MAIVVENNRAQLQYQVFKAGELAGYVQYSMDGAEMWALHTSMKRCFKSALLVEILIHHVLTDAHTSRLAVLPFCPALRMFIAEHPEYTRLVPAEWHDRIPSPAYQKADEDARIPLDFVRLTGSRRSHHHDTTPESPDAAEYIRSETGAIPLTLPKTRPMAGQPAGG